MSGRQRTLELACVSPDPVAVAKSPLIGYVTVARKNAIAAAKNYLDLGAGFKVGL